ncbi:MAG TPA: AAA family ATPase, partial [Tepidiformaceae bacterium]|nr:AAA family ATPase [Tepidiformaceae bacterium]
MPELLLIGGPNGAGKSTVAPRLIEEVLGGAPFVNADVIARGLAGRESERNAIRAGRLALEQIRALLERRESFAFESTLSSRTLVGWLEEARGAGYRVHLVYVWVPSAEESVRRVGQRVRSGGHAVPEEDVRRRYERGISNFREMYLPLADTWRMFSNAEGEGPRLVASGRGSQSRVYDVGTWIRIRRSMELREEPAVYDLDRAADKRITEAMRLGVGEALLKHKLLRQPVISGDLDGNVWEVQPDDIETGLTPEEEAEAI